MDTTKCIMSVNGRVRKFMEIPCIKGFENIKSIDYNFDTGSDICDIDIETTNVQCFDTESLIGSIVNKGMPDNSQCRVRVNMNNFAELRTNIDSYGRVLARV